MTGATTARNKVFISYSRDDAAYVPVVRKHLRPLERRHGLDIWDDSEIEAGADWMNEITGAIDSTRAVVLLVSASFLASDFIHTQELPQLLKQAAEHGAVVLAVHVGHSLYAETSGLSHLQSVNNPAAPLSDLSKGEQEKVFVKLAATVMRLFSQPPPARETTTPANRQTADALRELPLVSGALEELRQELRDKLGDDDTLYEPAALVAESIMLDGLRAVARRAHPKRFANLLTDSLAAALGQLRHAHRPLKTDELKTQFIRYAAGDDDLGRLVEVILNHREGDAPVRVELGGADDEWEVVKGVRLPGGFIGPEFVPAEGPREVVLEDVTVYSTPDTLSDDEEFTALVRKLFHENQTSTTPRHSLLVVAAGLDGRALRTILDEKAAGRNVTAARFPASGGPWKALLYDLTFVSIGSADGLIVNEHATYVIVSRSSSTMLKSADRVIVNEHETYVIVSRPGSTMLKATLDLIRKELGETDDGPARDELTARLNNLERGVVIVRVGGKSDEERRRRAERAGRVVTHYEAAAVTGVVAGEHLTLANAAAAVCAREADEEQKKADVIVSDALEAPLRRMAEDWGRDGAETLRAVRARQLETGNGNVGYYSEGDSFVDLFEVGAVVPVGNVLALMTHAIKAAQQRIAALRYTDEIVQEVAALEGG